MIHAYSVSTLQTVERKYTEAPEYDGWLMARAARALADIASQNLVDRDLVCARVLLLIGSGNNGADALYAGAHLLETGYEVNAYLVQGTAESKSLEAFQKSGGKILEKLEREDLLGYQLIIDGILGIGANRPLDQELRQLIEQILDARQIPTANFRIIACDIPTGLLMGGREETQSVLKADETVTFIAAKDVLLLKHYLVGKLHIVPLGIEEDLATYPTELRSWTPVELLASFPQPHPTDHKYSRGICGIVAGSNQYPGAAHISTQAAINSGCGMVLYQGPEFLAYQIILQTPEAVIGQKPTEEEKVSAWLVGPGTVGEERAADISGVFTSRRPAIIDAAALEPAARWIIDQGRFTCAQILTPHSGELLRILTWFYVLDRETWEKNTGLGEPSKEAIAQNPIEWVKLAALLTGATVMLKGTSALIATPGQEAFIYCAQTSWLATAGSGDTLSGILASLLAQHTARWEKNSYQPQETDYAQLVALGIYLHNQAALQAHGQKLGPVPPSIVNQHLAETIAKLLA